MVRNRRERQALETVRNREKRGDRGKRNKVVYVMWYRKVSVKE